MRPSVHIYLKLLITSVTLRLCGAGRGALRHDRPFSWRRALQLVVSLSLVASAGAQEGDEVDPIDPSKEEIVRVIPKGDVSGGGRFFYVIFEEIEDGEVEGEDWVIDDEVVSRGVMYYDGIDSLILRPETTYRMWAVYAENLRFGYMVFTTPRAGERFEIPRMAFFDFEDVDEDEDGLGELQEFIIGTQPLNADSDGDGLGDGAEVQQGLNPLDGLIAQTGVIASGPVPGTAIDICTVNNIAIVASGNDGVTVFNVEASDAPTRIAQINTPGFAQGIGCSGSLLAIADGTAGLTVIDISDPAGAQILHTVDLGGNAFSVTTFGNIAFVGLTNGRVIAVDMLSGEEISRLQNLGSTSIQDLGVVGDYLYIFQIGTLRYARIDDGVLSYVSSLSAPGGLGAGLRRQRMFVGRDRLYTSYTSGFNVFDISNPVSPFRLGNYNTSQFGWKQMVSNGSGLMIAPVAPNSTNDTAHNVSLYRQTDSDTEFEFVTEYETLGYTYAVSLYNGLAYLADGTSGLQVVNYQAYDNKGVPPEVELSVDAPNLTVEEGKPVAIIADVTDDVQVRNVMFYVDDVPTYTDGNFPYNFTLLAPLLSDLDEGENTFEVHAEASDTGGNLTATEPVTLTLVPDATPPRVKTSSPKNGAYSGKIRSVSVLFNEAIRRTTLNVNSFKLTNAGADEVFGTSDDSSVLGFLRYEESTFRATITTPVLLQPGYYRITVKSPLADLAGNRIEDVYTAAFHISNFQDNDRDGVPDDLEEDLGLETNNPDTDGDGILDGYEDYDFDGLGNGGEFILGTDPTDPDSDGDDIDDGDEDFDLDGLSDGEEFDVGTDPKKVDTDGDGIDDPSEIAEGLDPNDPNSKLTVVSSSLLASYLNAIPAPGPDGFTIDVTSPTVSYVNGTLGSVDEAIFVTISSPAVSFVNAFPYEPELETNRVIIASPVISFVNGVPDTPSATTLVTSPHVSYENDIE